jgi:hypothetical protein
MSAGYSKRPLAQKLGLKAGMRAHLIGAPDDYPMPEDVEWVEALEKPLDFIHYFVVKRDDLAKVFPDLKAALAPAGMLWISWLKKSAKTPTDLDENIIREIGLAEGLVDVKVAAVDERWSGLKFVYRLKDRA